MLIFVNIRVYSQAEQPMDEVRGVAVRGRGEDFGKFGLYVKEVVGGDAGGGLLNAVAVAIIEAE